MQWKRKPIAAIFGIVAMLGAVGTAGAQGQTCQEEARRLKADAEAKMATESTGSEQGLAEPVENWFGSPHSREEVLGKLEEAAEADDEGCAQMLKEAKELMGATE